jgi:hypothetical protein
MEGISPEESMAQGKRALSDNEVRLVMNHAIEMEDERTADIAAAELEFRTLIREAVNDAEF